MKYLIASLLCCAAMPCFANSIEVTCPKEIETTQTMKTHAPDFTVWDKSSPHYFDRFTFYSGNPHDNASLAPSDHTNAHAMWQFSVNDNIYISCSYYNTEMELYKKLPAGLTSCQVDYDTSSRGSASFLPKKIICEQTAHENRG